MSRLRRVLARVVFLGVGATQGGCCCPGYEDPELDVEVERTTPAVATLIDRCMANPDDCEPLCRTAVESAFSDLYVEILDCEVTPIAQGARVHVVYSENIACGRAPTELHPCAWPAADPVVRWLARAAYLEAASVAAFVHLAADLVRHRAPRALIEAAIVAAHDEVRHAVIMRALVGGRIQVPTPRVAPYRPASLRDLAMLNAIEGCARETVGAAINFLQARNARDPEIRAAFASIAPDELAHAELAWAIHAWVAPQLDACDRADVLAAHRQALAHIGEDSDAATRSVLGLPVVATTDLIAAELARAIT